MTASVVSFTNTSTPLTCTDVVIGTDTAAATPPRPAAPPVRYESPGERDPRVVQIVLLGGDVQDDGLDATREVPGEVCAHLVVVPDEVRTEGAVRQERVQPVC